MKKVALRYLVWLLPLGWAGFIFYLSAQSIPIPFEIEPPWLWLGMSKLGHLVIFGILAFFIVLAAGRRRYGYLIAFIVVVAYASLDEFHQAFTPGRDPSPVDVIIDGTGALLALALSYVTFRNKRGT